MKQECQDVADQQTFAKGDPQHLVFTQTKALSDPLDGRLVPQEDGECQLRLLEVIAIDQSWLLSVLPSQEAIRQISN